MLNVDVQISGDEQLIAKLIKLDAVISDFSGALKLIGEDLLKYYQDTVFNSMGGVYGTPWMKLAPSTIAQKTKHYRQYAAVPLVASGQMRDSFQAEATPHALKIENTAPYFVYHQSTAPRSKLPRRQMLGINNQVRSIIRNVIEADIRQKIRTL